MKRRTSRKHRSIRRNSRNSRGFRVHGSQFEDGFRDAVQRFRAGETLAWVSHDADATLYGRGISTAIESADGNFDVARRHARLCGVSLVVIEELFSEMHRTLRRNRSIRRNSRRSHNTTDREQLNLAGYTPTEWDNASWTTLSAHLRAVNRLLAVGYTPVRAAISDALRLKLDGMSPPPPLHRKKRSIRRNRH